MRRVILMCAATVVAMGLTPATAVAEPGDCPLDAAAQCDPAPEPAPDPPAPVRVAQCHDGSISFTQHSEFRGTCAKHGGTDRWLTDAPPDG